MAKGDKLKGALSREPRNRGTRVSPGVYRSPKGNLVRPRQQYMERRRQQQPNQPAPSGPPASLMGRIEAEGPTQQDFTGAVTNAMQYSPGQMGNAWGPNQGGRPMVRRGDERDRADMIGQQMGEFATNPMPRPLARIDNSLQEQGVDPRATQAFIDDANKLRGQNVGAQLGGQIEPGILWAPGNRPMPQAPLQGWNQAFANRFQPSANQGGRYRLSPGVYGTREQAERQYERETQRQPYEMYAKPYWKMS